MFSLLDYFCNDSYMLQVNLPMRILSLPPQHSQVLPTSQQARARASQVLTTSKQASHHVQQEQVQQKKTGIEPWGQISFRLGKRIFCCCCNFAIFQKKNKKNKKKYIYICFLADPKKARRYSSNTVVINLVCRWLKFFLFLFI